MPRSLSYYRDTLGFDIAFTFGEPPFFAEVRRDDVAFNLRHVDATPFLPGAQSAGQLLSVSIVTTDARQLFLDYQDTDVDFQEPLCRKPWGADEFVLRDPDGNLILFGSPAS